MPQFAPSSVHKATITFSNPKSAGFDYTASLCMGTDVIVMASASFHLDAGQSKPVTFSVTMPAASGIYPVYISVSSGGKVVALYKATEDVTIVTYAPISAIYASAIYQAGWAFLGEAPGIPGYWYMILEVKVQNVGTGPGTCHNVLWLLLSGHPWIGASAYWIVGPDIDLAAGEVGILRWKAPSLLGYTQTYKVIGDAGTIISPAWLLHYV